MIISMGTVTTLDKMKAGEKVVVRDIRGGCGVRRRLGNLGIHLDDSIDVIRSGFLGGPLMVRVHSVEIGLGRGMAEKILVETEEGR
jgi:Fe2+ transport system protein FeoA